MIQRLRFKFVLVNMGIVTILLCTILGLVFYFTSAQLEMESIRMMEDIASRPFQLDAPGEPGPDVRLPFFTLQVGPHGELMSADGGYYDLSDGDLLSGLVATAAASPQRLGVISEYELRYYRVDAPASQRLVFADISSERATLEGLRTTCLLIGGLSFFAFLWVSILLSKWAVRPVELAWKQQRRFVAAASHELKTPLTVIMTNAELLAAPELREEKREKSLSSILAMSRQMRGLIEQMLELARTDSPEAAALFRPVDLSRLVSQAVLPFESLFFERGLSLDAQVEEGIGVTGEETQLRRVVEILLDNAQKYAKPGGSAAVVLRRRGRGRCVLSVSDEGDPIPPEERRQIFQRFYRADPARSRDGSFGLGLSIAEGIVKQHRGRIWAESRDGRNIFSVELPCP
ncbi:cell wall metabolism sensor histidine kinase WalK [uncultured Intestinimonas sp.]|uniref:sensor histidine kinase n=1 Tax=uncultured Intestinimonas sp. TaxID=1689265 RepID=UPI002609B454|nr:HAMP domain-containing sensor histidine kinase [uncultured Intestinimonas sp.]